jgi:hypothetical protein
MKLILLCALLAGCSSKAINSDFTSKYTNSPTMGDAARAGGEKPF